MVTVTARAGTRPGMRGGIPVTRITGKKIREAARKVYPARKNGVVFRRRTFMERLYIAWLMAPDRARGNQNIRRECYRLRIRILPGLLKP